MNFKLIKSINKRSRLSPIDFMMIMISNKMRYLFIFILIFMWFRNDFYKKLAWKAILSSGVTLLINTFIKLFYFRPRPFMKRRIGILIPSKMDSSFPSKHTLLVFAVSTTVFLYKRFLGSIMLGLSVLTGFSRIWVGHHYISDIIGSAFIASMTSIVLERNVWRRKHTIREEEEEVVTNINRQNNI